MRDVINIERIDKTPEFTGKKNNNISKEIQGVFQPGQLCKILK